MVHLTHMHVDETNSPAMDDGGGGKDTVLDALLFQIPLFIRYNDVWPCFFTALLINAGILLEKVIQPSLNEREFDDDNSWHR